MSRMNEVTLFSNGMGHFRRVHQVPKDKKTDISIPFKKDAIGDVASSIQVFGKVKLEELSFTPMGGDATRLEIDQSFALKSLLRNLSGSKVTVTFFNSIAPEQFTLLGMDEDSRFVDHVKVDREFVILLSADKQEICRKQLEEIKNISFDEESVRTEISKALKNNFQLIKPDSTLLDMSLLPLEEADTEAVIQYTIPVAAWKMRYAIRQDNSEKFTLEGAAIIDNNTDEDWDNFKISVVTGNPVSFQTNIAAICTPKRKFVQVVEDVATSNMDVEQGVAVQAMACAAPSNAGGRNYSGGLSKKSIANTTQFGLESLREDAVGYSTPVAEAPGVEAKDVGDFCVFTSKEPITILARKSAVVPMFSVSLSKAGLVLVYRASSHARRPYRAIKFKNESEYSLGRGKTIIYNQGVFSGECMLEATKPGENRMLPHCLENGVRIVMENLPSERRSHALKISDGIGISEEICTAVSTYTIENKKNEAFKLALEHVNILQQFSNLKVDFSGATIKEQEKLVETEGYRIYLELAPLQTIVIKATETSLLSSRTAIGGYFGWIQGNVINAHNPLAENKNVQACMLIQQDIDRTAKKIDKCEEERDTLLERCGRARENLESSQIDQESVGRWLNDLNAFEDKIREIEDKTLPELKESGESLKEKLTAEIKKISANWQEK